MKVPRMVIVCVLVSMGFVSAVSGFVLAFFGVPSGRILYLVAGLMEGIAGGIASTIRERGK